MLMKVTNQVYPMQLQVIESFCQKEKLEHRIEDGVYIKMPDDWFDKIKQTIEFMTTCKVERVPGFEFMELTPEEIETTKGYRFSEEWIKASLYSQKAWKWIKEYLEEVKNTSMTRGWRCYVEGTIIYKRKDGTSITGDDIAALKFTPLGQKNDIKRLDDHHVQREWLCDSSD
jgi:hypothetical protein